MDKVRSVIVWLAPSAPARLLLAVCCLLPLQMFGQCNVSPSSFTLTSGGGALQVNITTAGTCTWTAASNAGFITGVAPPSGSGSGSVSFTVASNVTTSTRTGTLTIAGQTVTVTQAGVLFISTSTLPAGVVATPYNQPVTGVGGIGPYSWSISAGPLPQGLTLGSSNSLSVNISGVPAVATTANFTISLSDSLGSSTSRNLSITISVATLTINCAAPGPIRVGTPFQLSCAAGGGTPPYTFTIATGNLPPGLSLNSTTGIIGGTPTTAGQFSFTVRVTDAGSPQQSATSSTITLSPAVGLVISCGAPGPIRVGASFQLSCSASGGTFPYTYSISSGSLPPGLNLSSATGVISGTPTNAGQFNFTVQATDSGIPAQSATSAQITLSPSAGLSISCAVPEAIIVGTAFQLACTAAGGGPPYTYSIGSGNLPQGLDLNPPTGLISGTPTTTGASNFTIRATDASSPAQTATSPVITLTPVVKLTIDCGPSTAISLGTPYQAACTTAGGTSPYVYQIASGGLPAGLTLNASTGAISGTPTTAGRFTFAIRVIDSGLPPQIAVSPNVTLTVGSGLTITCPSAGPISVGVVFQLACTAGGGSAPYVYAVGSGSLPPGLSLNTATGAISGTPATAGQFSFTIKVSDSSSPAQTATSATVTLSPAAGLTINCGTPGPIAVGTPFQFTCTASGGTSPYVFAIASGSLPAGVSLNASTGLISGTPAASGQFSITVRVTDAGTPPQSATSPAIALSPAGRLSISCASPGPIAVGTPFQLACTASGGTAPYTFAIATSSLPPGLTLNASTGTISGTPNQAGQFGISVRVTDSGSPSQSAISPTIVFSPASPLSISCAQPGPVSPGATFQLACTASGGIAPYTFAIATGNLPPGLSLNGSTGVISGTATISGQLSFSVRVTDSGAPSQSATSPIITLSPASPLTISCPPAGPATLGVAYELACSAGGGVAPYTFTIGSGSLPAGLSLNATTGTIGGIPTVAGQFNVSIRVTDSGSPAQSATSPTITLTSGPQLTINCPLPGAIGLGAALQYACTAGGGTPPYSFSIASGSLPPGLNLNANTGEVTGTPAIAGQFSFTVRVTDAASPAQSATSTTITLSPGAGLTLTCPTPGPTAVGAAFQLTCTTTGGSAPYTYVIASGTLPPGLSLNASTGVIGGIPASAGPFTFTIRVTDSGNPPRTATSTSITLSPGGALSLTCSAPGPIAVGTAFQLACNASGGKAPYVFTIASGSLPPGIGLNASTGVISGTPTAAGQFSFSLRVTDAGTPPQSATASVTLSPGSGLTVACAAPGAIAIGVPFQLACTASGGASPYTYSIASGSLPPGLNLNATTGSISGIPTTQGLFTFTVGATDASTPPASATTETISLSTAPGLRLSCGVPRPTQVGIAFALNCTAAGGNAPYSYTIAKGDLPPGVSLAAATGTITGTPTLSGQFAFTVQVADSGSPPQVATSPVTVMIFDASTGGIVSVSPSAGVQGSTVAVTFTGDSFAADTAVTANSPGLQLAGLKVLGPNQITASVAIAPDAAQGQKTLTVSTPGAADRQVSFFVVAKPAVSVTLVTSSGPANSPTVGVNLGAPATDQIDGTLSLSFRPDAAMVSASYFDPALQFIGGGRDLAFTIAPGGTTADLLQKGALQEGTVAGDIVVQLTSLQTRGVDVLPATPPTQTITINRQPPVITSGGVQLVDVSDSSFTVTVTGYSTPRDLRSVTFLFTPASGSQLGGGTTATVPLDADSAKWFASDAGLNNGSRFVLRIPFTLTGSSAALGTVTVTLSNSSGTSVPVTGGR